MRAEQRDTSGGKAGQGLPGSETRERGPDCCGLGMSSELRTSREQEAGGLLTTSWALKLLY